MGLPGLSKLTYTALMWGHEVKKTMGKRLALSQLLQPWRTMAAESMEVLAAVMPVDLLLQELATKVRLIMAGPLKARWDRISDKGKKVGHRKMWDDLLHEWKAMVHSSDTMMQRRI